MNEEITKALVTLANYRNEYIPLNSPVYDAINVIVNGYSQAEKSLKALEVVKAKEVNVRDFMNICKMPYEHYLYMWKDGHFLGVKMVSKTMLAQEEYDLLKEVF